MSRLSRNDHSGRLSESGGRGARTIIAIKTANGGGSGTDFNLGAGNYLRAQKVPCDLWNKIEEAIIVPSGTVGVLLAFPFNRFNVKDGGTGLDDEVALFVGPAV